MPWEKCPREEEKKKKKDQWALIYRFTLAEISKKLTCVSEYQDGVYLQAVVDIYSHLTHLSRYKKNKGKTHYTVLRTTSTFRNGFKDVHKTFASQPSLCVQETALVAKPLGHVKTVNIYCTICVFSL